MNPGSGRRRGRAAEAAILGAARKLDREVVLRRLDRRRSVGDQARQALSEGHAVIVAAGGDGTICGIAAALAGSDTPMGVLPLGTFNYFARSLGIPADLEAAVALLQDGVPRRIPVGRVNGRVFLNNASIGAYPAILAMRERVYDRWGRSRAAAYWSVLRALLGGRHAMMLDLDLDGERRQLRSPLVFVMLNAFQLEQLSLDGQEIIENGRFAVFIAPEKGRWGMIRSAIALATGRLSRSRDFELLGARDLTIATPAARNRVARDGERARLEGPFHFTLEQGALEVLVPGRHPGLAPASHDA
ncbi:diacylglycerol/lipid kinase family protein [Plastorhodobacter daqingensis]|uniref:Diacylglycerol/lipid kinase family protein n=1 Tax=Plastorhodobacter daqingensis TaxID=1387281 RepID=A0ABW2UL07_9RHOB